MTGVFDHSFLSSLLGDEEMAALLDAEAELADIVSFEIALAEAEAAQGVIPPEAAMSIAVAARTFVPDIAALKAGVAQDGVVVPELIRQMRRAVGEPHAAHLHFGATSQDAIDTAAILRLRRCLTLLRERIEALEQAFEALGERTAGRRLMGYTRMQPAIEMSAADRIAAWRDPLRRHLARLEEVLRLDIAVQFGGAVGTLDKLGGKGLAVRADLAARLGLPDAPQWHSQRDRIVEIANWLSELSGILGKFGQDVALMAQQDGAIELAGGGGSSAMPHKRNPVAAEVLVALARFNATQVSGLHHSMVHEQERSGAAWTLEWMLVPAMAMAAGAATVRAIDLLRSIECLGHERRRVPTPD